MPLFGMYQFVSVASMSPPCPGARRHDVGAGGSRWAPVTAATASEMQRTWVPLPAEGVPRDFCAGMSLIKRKLQATFCAATWFGTERGKNLVPACSWGGGARASLSSRRIIIFQQNFLSHLSVFLQLKQFLLPNFQHLEFGFSLLKKKFKIRSLDETPMPLYLPTIFSLNFVSLANARSSK